MAEQTSVEIELAVYRLKLSKTEDLDRVQSFYDAVTLAASQVQSMQIQLVKTPIVSFDDRLVDFFIYFALESGIVGTVISFTTRRIFAPLARRSELFARYRDTPSPWKEATPLGPNLRRSDMIAQREALIAKTQKAWKGSPERLDAQIQRIDKLYDREIPRVMEDARKRLEEFKLRKMKHFEQTETWLARDYHQFSKAIYENSDLIQDLAEGAVKAEKQRVRDSSDALPTGRSPENAEELGNVNPSRYTDFPAVAVQRMMMRFLRQHRKNIELNYAALEMMVRTGVKITHPGGDADYDNPDPFVLEKSNELLCSALELMIWIMIWDLNVVVSNAGTYFSSSEGKLPETLQDYLLNRILAPTTGIPFMYFCHTNDAREFLQSPAARNLRTIPLPGVAPEDTIKMIMQFFSGPAEGQEEILKIVRRQVGTAAMGSWIKIIKTWMSDQGLVDNSFSKVN